MICEVESDLSNTVVIGLHCLIGLSVFKGLTKFSSLLGGLISVMSCLGWNMSTADVFTTVLSSLKLIELVSFMPLM